jgi:hypothetical protein
MQQESSEARARHEDVGRASSWSPPRYEVIPLDCEITAYAPDGDLPLF